ncbi:guanylate-binding protein 6 [Exaiptasia diaphana]|uniref:GB1/RHD3-type G domain-containing protein n=1 Tax=Exaiptasia diaphana TaxID=2652724 RepID=A0A913XRS5_EXADI|nr:guanylate-binding protein 6 [Exaiptasia diaphana]XP_020908675.1 guanylate-binding protein 6 [Exaiptasia diaphana]KXJ09693.1 Guanylate-binding protein 6 [Exaiptasia diaphana]
MSLSKHDKLAIPLVLPNNCTWDEKTGKYSKKLNVERRTLTVVPEALEQLKEIKGPVCVVSIAGPCRSGKSYILSKVFDQGQVFPLGHLLDPETMGIWLWVVPEKFKDSTGREFTVVLMDSEGIDAVSSEDSDDHRIFTLSVLLSSIMIYNSAVVPKRSDLEGLDFIVKLSQRIQLYTNQPTTDEQQFSEAFPYFIWLLRDVQLSLPEGCKTMNDYFIKSVLNLKAEGNTMKAKKTAESILKYFPGFYACSLPPPACDDEILKGLDDESKVNPKFLKKVDEFKDILHSKLSSKKSINKGEFVTGEALAALTKRFVEALNTPGAVPNVQNAWDTFVQTKCREVLADAVQVYEQEMMSLVEKKIPCEADLLRSAHDNAMEKCLEMFRNETFSFSIKTVDKYLKELEDRTESILSSWLERNSRETETFCTQLIKELKRTILDPVLARLHSQEGSKMQRSDIVDAYHEVEQKYSSNARGAKDVKTSVFMNFHPELKKEKKQSIELLQQLKYYEESLAKAEKAAKAAEENTQKIKKEKARIYEKEKRNAEIEVEFLRHIQRMREIEFAARVFVNVVEFLYETMQNPRGPPYWHR